MMNKNIFVYGDIIIDHYAYGVLINNPTEKGKVFKISKEEDRLGGAAAVANYLPCNGMNICLCGIEGADSTAYYELIKQTNIDDWSTFDDRRVATTKTRYVLEKTNKILDTRYDIESTKKPRKDIISYFKEMISHVNQNEYSMILVSDYNKGAVVEEVLNLANPSIPMIIDPGYDRPWSMYPKHAIIKANLREARKEAGNESGDPLSLLMSLKTHDTIVLTAGDDGIYYKQNGGYMHIPGIKVPVVDVCGAGDVVLASIGLSLVNGGSLYDACVLANENASKHIQTIGHKP